VVLTFDLLTLKVVSKSPVPILVFLGLSVLDLGPVYATDRQTDSCHRLMPPPIKGGGIITECGKNAAEMKLFQLHSIELRQLATTGSQAVTSLWMKARRVTVAQCYCLQSHRASTLIVTPSLFSHTLLDDSPMIITRRYTFYRARQADEVFAV